MSSVSVVTGGNHAADEKEIGGRLTENSHQHYIGVMFGHALTQSQD